MPITVKLGRSRLSSNQSGQVEEAGSPDTGLSEARRTVSFNESSPLQSSLSLPAFEYNEQQQLGLASAAVPAKRVRSPSPPLDGTSSCLPIPAAKKHKIQSPSSQDIDLCLESVVRRYAALAGYDGIQSSVLQLLSQWLQEYLNEIVAVAAEGATSSGRVAPNARDLLKAIWWHGQLVPVDVDEDDDRASRGSMNADGLIAWRHRIPDYQEQYPIRRQTDPGPLLGWLESEQATVPLQRQNDVGDDEDVFTMELFSNKTRLKEKSRRDEIPSHLPPLPALYTWRRTDSFPTNRLLGNPTSSTSMTQTLAQHPTASSTLARLESRLVSSRLVQTSLSSLIGRLDNAASPVIAPEASIAPEDATTQGATGSASLPNSTEPVVSSPMALPGRESPAVGSPSRKESTSMVSSRKESTSMASPLIAGAQSVDAVSTPVRTGGRLSVKLRPQSISGSTVAEALKLSSQPSAMLPPPVPASTSPEQDASSALVARRGISGHPTLSLSTSQPLTALRRNPLNSLAGFSFPATPGQKTAGMPAARPWDHPLMSPATPMTAGGLGSVTTPLGHAGGMLGRQDSIGGGFFSGAGGGYATPDHGSPRVVKNGLEGTSVVIPQVVNYKSVWYGKKN